MRGLLIFLCVCGLGVAGDLAWAAEPVTAVEAVQVDMDGGLGLTPEQKDKIRAIRDEYKSRRDFLKNELNSRYEFLRKALDADTLTQEKIDPMVAEIKTIQGQMVDNRVDVVIKLRAVYTPEQIRKIKQGAQVIPSKAAVKRPVKKIRKLETGKK